MFSRFRFAPRARVYWYDLICPEPHEPDPVRGMVRRGDDVERSDVVAGEIATRRRCDATGY